MNLDEFLDQFVKKVEEMGPNLSLENRLRINQAAAKVFKTALENYLRENHVRDRATGENPHLYTAVRMKGTNINNFKDGSYIVGFDKSKAYIARFLDKGTKFPRFTTRSHRYYKKAGETAVSAIHFMDQLHNDVGIRAAMHEAAQAEYSKICQEIMNGKNPEKWEDEAENSLAISGKKGDNKDEFEPLKLDVQLFGSRHVTIKKDTPIKVSENEFGTLEKGTKIEQVTVIAGKGRSRSIDEIDRLMNKYPGARASDWKKVKGVISGDGGAEIHWYQADGVGKVEFKVKER